MEDPVAAALARLSKAQAKCAKELLELSASHADSPAWASAGIAAAVRLCHDPAAAADAVAVLGCLSEGDDANDDLIREAGAIPMLLTLLTGGPASDVAANVAWALGNLAYGDATGVAAIMEAGAIPTLAAMLSGGPESTAPHFAAYALQNLASDSEAARAAIVETGAIVPLLALLRGGPESRAASRAAGVLCNYRLVTKGAMPSSRRAPYHRCWRCFVVGPSRGQLNAPPERCRTCRLAPTQQPCWRRLRAPRSTAPSGKACERGCAHVHQKSCRRRRRARPWRRWSTRSRWRRRCRWTRPPLNVRRRGCGRSTATRSGRSGASRLGWGHLRCRTSSCARLRWTRCEVCRRRPRRPQRSRTAAARVPRLRRRPGGGVRRPLIRAVRHRLGAPRRQRLEPAHPRAAAGDLLPEPCPEAAHAGARGGHAACGGHRRGERQRRRPAAGPRSGWRRAVEPARSKAEPSRSCPCLAVANLLP
jgi:hypothetical protein